MGRLSTATLLDGSGPLEERPSSYPRPVHRSEQRSSDSGSLAVSWRSLYGVFNTCAAAGHVTVQLPDGVYHDVLTGEMLRVECRQMPMPVSVAILRYDIPMQFEPFFSDMLDYNVERR